MPLKFPYVAPSGTPVPTSLIGNLDLDLLWLPFVESFLEVLAMAQAKGVHYHARLGYRTISEQQNLFEQGRTKPGPRVTNAPGGKSMHNFGLAVDVVRDADLVTVGLQPRWDAAGYDLLNECAQKVSAKTGLVQVTAGLLTSNGNRWDYGHVQVDPRKNFGLRERELLAKLQGKSPKAAWVELDLLRSKK